MKYHLIALLFLLLVRVAHADLSLFEESIVGSDQKNPSPFSYQINGYVRGVYFGGKNTDTNKIESKSKYSEFALKLSGSAYDNLNAYLELRHTFGDDLFEDYNDTTVREGYLSLYLGNFDFIIGEQIIVWGRADGINPTNNITPINYKVRSSDEDDKRESNFLVRAVYNMNPIKFEAIWVPEYQACETTFATPFIEGAVLGKDEVPGSGLDTGSYAFKTHFEYPSIDGSVSYYNGLDVNPGVDYEVAYDGYLQPYTRLFQSSYRIYVIGADFSTTIGSFGLRGEFAYKRPTGKYRDRIYVPKPEMQYILGVDREKGNFSILAQYIGKYVHDFEPLSPPKTPEDIIRNGVIFYNRLSSSQVEEMTHSISMRPKLELLNETLELEILGVYNATTEEIYLKPLATFDVVDDLKLILGGEFYWGPEKTLYGMMEDQQSAVFIEIKKSF